jgi:hypothetical protein
MINYKYKYKPMNDEQFIKETGLTNFKGETIIGDDMFLYFEEDNKMTLNKASLDIAVLNHTAIFPEDNILIKDSAEDKLKQILEIINK